MNSGTTIERGTPILGFGDFNDGTSRVKAKARAGTSRRRKNKRQRLPTVICLRKFVVVSRHL